MCIVQELVKKNCKSFGKVDILIFDYIYDENEHIIVSKSGVRTPAAGALLIM